jgi:hypothetical protein
MSRKCFHKVDDQWVETPFAELRTGEVFRLEDAGIPVIEQRYRDAVDVGAWRCVGEVHYEHGVPTVRVEPELDHQLQPIARELIEKMT